MLKVKGDIHVNINIGKEGRVFFKLELVVAFWKFLFVFILC